MSLILDHINGVPEDNRLENLRIVCPNCAATLDTHCGRKCRTLDERECQLCGKRFIRGMGLSDSVPAIADSTANASRALRGRAFEG